MIKTTVINVMFTVKLQKEIEWYRVCILQPGKGQGVIQWKQTPYYKVETGRKEKSWPKRNVKPWPNGLASGRKQLQSGIA